MADENYQLSVDLIGAAELKAAIANTQSVATKAILGAVNKAAIKTEALAKEFVPHQTGTLQRSIHAQPATVTLTNIEAHVGTNLEYAKYQEGGTRAHQVAVVSKRVLANKKTGQIFGTFANIPAMAGKYYMKKAKETVVPFFTNYMTAAIKTILDNLATTPTNL